VDSLIVSVAIGLIFVLIVLAMLPGARFWFGLLDRFGSLRESGPKPPAGG